jgi:hypothetical protein
MTDAATFSNLYDAGMKSGRSTGWFEATAALFDLSREATGTEFDVLRAAWVKLTEIRDAQLNES